LIGRASAIPRGSIPFGVRRFVVNPVQIG